MTKKRTKDVALVLSSGGARGIAFIGAIEELESRGYNITSVAGCSMGSLIGGVYAAGGLEAFKEWLFSLNDIGIMSLVDPSISKSYLVKGDKVISAIKEIVPNINIQDLKIPFSAVATDLYTGEEVVFREGPLFEAIRASISVPSFFRPVKNGHRTLIDGGLVNTLPLNRVARNGHDILVGFDVNDIDKDGINAFLEQMYRLNKNMTVYKNDTMSYIGKLGKKKDVSLLEKIREVGGRGIDLFRLQKDTASKQKKLIAESAKKRIPVGAEDSYLSILKRSFSIANHVIADRMIEACPPDVLARLPLDAVPSGMAYAKGRELSEIGRHLMADALDRYESSLSL